MTGKCTIVHFDHKTDSADKLPNQADSAIVCKINNAFRFFEGAYKCNLTLSGRNKKTEIALPTYVRTDMWFCLSLEASQGRIQSAIKNSTTCSSLVGRQQKCQT